MAYVIVTAGGEELDRRELLRCTVIGRSSECDLPIRDILLSRRHCQIEQTRTGWILTDLQSKNGTYVARQQVESHPIEDGDLIRLGRTTISFHLGPFVPTPPGTPKRRVARPTDPNESLEGTVAGFTLKEEDESEETALPAPAAAPVMHFDLSAHHPRPHPGPPVPRSYITEGVHEMLQEMASDMWDSVVATAPRPRLSVKRLPKPRPRPRTPAESRSADEVVLSLQVTADALSEPAGSAGTTASPPRPLPKPVAPSGWNPTAQSPRHPRVRPGFLVTVVVLALAVLLGGYLLTLRLEHYASAGSMTADIEPRQALTRGSMPND